MTLGDMQEFLHHTQTISVKCRQTTRAVIIYIGCDQKLLFRFSVFSSGVQPSELHRKTDHLFGDVNRPAPSGSGRGLHELTAPGIILAQVSAYKFHAILKVLSESDHGVNSTCLKILSLS